jgi:hypothetical protein
MSKRGSRCSSGSIEIRLRPGRPGLDSRKDRELFLCHRAQNDFGVRPTSHTMCIGGSFPRDKAARTWSWPLTSLKCRGYECVELYIHSPITSSWCVAYLSKGYFFMAWYLIKEKNIFTLTNQLVSQEGLCYTELIIKTSCYRWAIGLSKGVHHHRTIVKNKDAHSSFRWDSKPQSQYSNCRKTRDHRSRLNHTINLRACWL